MAKVLTGKVISTKMQNTAVVEVERAYQHPMYKKTIRRHKKYKAHVDDAIKVQDGDIVEISEIRPMSKEKKFKITTVKKD